MWYIKTKVGWEGKRALRDIMGTETSEGKLWHLSSGIITGNDVVVSYPSPVSS